VSVTVCGGTKLAHHAADRSAVLGAGLFIRHVPRLTSDATCHVARRMPRAVWYVVVPAQIDVPYSAEELFPLFDRNSSGDVSIDELTNALVRRR
jgi:hypothetical protein